MRSSGCACALLVAGILSAGLVEPSAQLQTRDRFRSGVELVEVDVIVTEGSGRPVRGLTRDDFEVLEDGIPVEIVSFDAIELPDPDETSIPDTPAASPGVFLRDNLQRLDGNIYVILLDFDTDPARFDRVRKAAMALIERLGPADQVAMLSMYGQRQYQVEFTTDRTRLARALERLVPKGETAEKLPDTIERIARGLEPLQSRRKVMALISEGFFFDPTRPEFRKAFDAARRAHLAIYTFDPRFVGGIDGFIDVESVAKADELRMHMRQSTEGLQLLAENTGGRATVRTNFLPDAVRRMAAENRTYYLLRYYSPSPQDGKFHRISVRTTRPGLEVRARPGYLATRRSASATGRSAPLGQQIIGLPVQSHGLAMRTVGLVVPGSRGGRDLLVVTEVRGADLAGGSGIELRALALDMRGRVRAGDTFSATLSSQPGADDRWLRIVTRLSVPEGRLQLRLAAVRLADGPAGSVFSEIEVPRSTDALSVGGLVLGTPDRRGVARSEHLGALPVVPIATTDLPAGMAAAAVLPLHVAQKHRDERLRAAASLVNRDGSIRPLLDVDAIASKLLAGGVLQIPLPLESLGPGEYRLRVDVTMEGSTEVRELTFRVVPTPSSTDR